MFEDKEMPITLEISGSPMDLHVIGFTGRDALNEPYRFDIDLISDNPHLDVKCLVLRPAWLALDAGGSGFHGLISAASQVYAGTCLSLYRITLAPGLLKLEQRGQRRVFLDMSVPQLIVRLLEEHGLDASCVRFEQLVGAYPPRHVCVQYDETDLHLLQRLCEEEGIHFRFKHSRDGHRLVFADDPASFPERQAAVHLRLDEGLPDQPAISYLSEHLTLRSEINRQNPVHHARDAIDTRPPDLSASPDRTATNEPFDTLPNGVRRNDEVHHRQISARTLERLRCERRHIHGRSHHCALTSGQIMRVLDHPIALFNDQWLLVSVHHWGKQPQGLEGSDPHDIAAILSAAPSMLNAEAALSSHPQPSKLSGLEVPAFDHGYRNSFSVLPWAMTFRPSLIHRRPRVGGYQHVTLMCDAADCSTTREKLPIRYDWQQAASLPDASACWPLAQLSAMQGVEVSGLKAGARLLISHFDQDPERPLICGVLEKKKPLSHLRDAAKNIRLSDKSFKEAQENIHLDSHDLLILDSGRNLRLKAANATFELRPEGVTVTGPKTFKIGAAKTDPTPSPEQPDTLCSLDIDLRLTEQPGLAGKPLADRIWYIVYMSKPGLDQLARLEPRHFLFEGKTDERGFLGLVPAQIRGLASHYRRHPSHICLVHPGSCILLQTWFAQNWSEEQLLAFVQLAERD
jgi:type VI secretion system secreted protein VgrG